MEFAYVNHERSRSIFENSDKFLNQQNLKLHKCSEEKPSEIGVYIGYEQDDLLDQYLVIWDGDKWIHFESGGEIGFGSEYREDHWSELLSEENPCSKIELPRYMVTCSNVIYQMRDLENQIRNINPKVYEYDREEIISKETENAFQMFKFSLNKDLSKLSK